MNKSTAASAVSGLAGTCFYGDGNIVKQFIPADMLGMLDSVTSQLNVDTIKAMGYASTNIDQTYAAVDVATYCGYPMFYKKYTTDSDTMYADLNTNMTFRNETNNIVLTDGSSVTQKEFIMSDLSSVNLFLKSNPKYATSTEIDNATSATVGTDLFLDLSTISLPMLNGKIRFTCDDVGTSFKRFIVSEDCATTDNGVTIKSIHELKDVTSALTNNPPTANNYPLCYDFKTWTEFTGF